ncbi:MAG: hypothetical protein ACR2OC_08675 [Solirubrobacterales bacterium]
MEYALAVLIVIALVAFVAAPLRRGSGPGAGSETEDPRLAELEARKEGKYREIRDTAMDRAQGKLSEADFARQDGELRREAIAILKELDRVQGTRPPAEKSQG